MTKNILSYIDPTAADFCLLCTDTEDGNKICIDEKNHSRGIVPEILIGFANMIKEPFYENGLGSRKYLAYEKKIDKVVLPQGIAGLILRPEGKKFDTNLTDINAQHNLYINEFLKSVEDCKIDTFEFKQDVSAKDLASPKFAELTLALYQNSDIKTIIIGGQEVNLDKVGTAISQNSSQTLSDVEKAFYGAIHSATTQTFSDLDQESETDDIVEPTAEEESHSTDNEKSPLIEIGKENRSLWQQMEDSFKGFSNFIRICELTVIQNALITNNTIYDKTGINIYGNLMAANEAISSFCDSVKSKFSSFINKLCPSSSPKEPAANQVSEQSSHLGESIV